MRTLLPSPTVPPAWNATAPPEPVRNDIHATLSSENPLVGLLSSFTPSTSGSPTQKTLDVIVESQIIIEGIY